MKLRSYQKEIIDLFEQNDNSFLVQIPTGGGKSFVMSTITKIAASRGSKVLIIMNGTSLVHQMSKSLTQSKVDHGIVQASELTDKKVHVCSIDTLRRRKLPKADLIIVDEAHRAISKGWQTVLEFYKDVRKISFTATPFTKEPLAHLGKDLVMPVDYKALVQDNFLVKMRTFVPKTLLDLSSVKERGGDYDEKELFEKLNTEPQYHDLFTNYQKYLEGRPTLCFAVNVQHAKNIATYFTEKGINTAHIEAETPLEERQRLIDALKKRELSMLTSVGTLTTGIDVPPVSGLLVARPTLSKILHIQMLGRGSRISEGKKDCIILDMVENTKTNGFIDEAGIGWLKPGKIKKGEPKKRTCPSCFRLIPLSRALKCPECAFVFEVKKKEEEKIKKSSIEVTTNLTEVTNTEEYKIAALKDFVRQGKKSGFKEGWVFHQVKNAFGEPFAKKHLKYQRIYKTFASERAL